MRWAVRHFSDGSWLERGDDCLSNFLGVEYFFLVYLKRTMITRHHIVICHNDYIVV